MEAVEAVHGKKAMATGARVSTTHTDVAHFSTLAICDTRIQWSQAGTEVGNDNVVFQLPIEAFGERIATACSIGAKFSQRRFWERWRIFIAERRSLRLQNSRGAQSQDISDRTAGIQLAIPAWHDLPDDHAQLLQRNDTINLFLPQYISADMIREVSSSSRQCSSKDIIVNLKLRHYFKVWNARVQAPFFNISAGTGFAGKKILHFRTVRAIRRWKAYTVAAKAHAIQRQRAHFFLYYHLTKRLLTCLRQFTKRKKHERAAVVILERLSKHCLLRSALCRWRLRQSLRTVLGGWRVAVQRGRRERALLEAMQQSILRDCGKRLLRQSLACWRQAFLETRSRRALKHVIDCYIYARLCQLAWNQWRSNVCQLVQLERQLNMNRRRLLFTVWNEWSKQARDHGRIEQLRRRAVRFRYIKLLRMAFDCFCWFHHRYQDALSQAALMKNTRNTNMIACILSSWKTAIVKQRRFHQAMLTAEAFYESHLMRRVLSDGFIRLSKQRTLKTRTADEFRNRQLKRLVCHAFNEWNRLYRKEQSRFHLLSESLEAYIWAKNMTLKRRVFDAWAEYARSATAKRIINAQIRGQRQMKVLQECFSQWICSVAQLRRAQIQNRRANLLYAATLKKKCFERWKRNAGVQKDWRNQNRLALIHWKITLQQRTFAKWREYLKAKKSHRERIHAAMEFRHEQFLRDGLRGWMIAAVYLQEQREIHASESQASHTAWIWRRVAAIARHWRYITLKKTQRDRNMIPDDILTTRLNAGESEGWLAEQPRIKQIHHLLPPVVRPHDRKPISELTVAENMSRTHVRSTLSDFVLLPRNRPQPRRPIELLIQQSHAAVESDEPKSNKKRQEANQYGFQFPVNPSAPLFVANVGQSGNDYSEELIEPVLHGPFNASSESPVAKTTEQLDELERQLLELKARKQEWKNLQGQLAIYRQNLQNAQVTKAMSQDQVARMTLKIRDMEKRNEQSIQWWTKSKEQVRWLAEQIRIIRASIQS